VVGHRPADNPAAVGVLDGGEVDPSLPGPEVGDVGHPEDVGHLGPEVTLDEVISDADARDADRGATALADHQPRQARPAHEALHALA
jgi:hypothetical protein